MFIHEVEPEGDWTPFKLPFQVPSSHDPFNSVKLDWMDFCGWCPFVAVGLLCGQLIATVFLLDISKSWSGYRPLCNASGKLSIT